ncbi:anti-sigma factor family protein [Spirillospora sp. CA-142024]|uniref:anti-sigma factor family protein n=1 Tax=Spirillospora sp. CA-142024 TaxID=3240036 RepID=UPI003D93A716
MTDRPECAETRQVLPELAAGVAPPEERARALRHLAGCGRCHRELEAQTALVDELLQLVPERQPPAGFEAATLAPMLRRERPRRLRNTLALAASALLVAGAAGAAVWQKTSDDRQLADSYRKTLSVAHGRYLRTVPVDGDGAKPSGYVFAYQGSPAWLFVTMTSVREPGAYQITLTTQEGRDVSLGTMTVKNEQGSWGTTVPVTVHDILLMRFHGPSGDLLAHFG